MLIIKNNICYMESEDLEFLGSLPRNIYHAINYNEFYSNIFNFIKIDDKDAIGYFKSNKKILNYQHVKNLSSKDLDKEINKINDKLAKLALKWSDSSTTIRHKLAKDTEYNEQVRTLKYILKSLIKYKSSKASYDAEISTLNNKIKRVELKIYNN